MTNEDKIALKEFLGGVAVAIGISVVFLLLVFASGIVSVGDTELKPSAEVVGTYKECDIVRYTPDHSAKYYYFLDCSSK